jgi:ATP-dependent exoDNAse (exonuclease V) beta subunit
MPHISFSALKNWDFCPFYHKLTYIDRIKIFQGNVYTAFGTALHETCEEMVKDDSLDYEKHFNKCFKGELNKIQLEDDKQKLISEQMYKQGVELAPLAVQELKRKFPGFEIVSTEEEIIEPIVDAPGDYDFKGFVDLVIKTPDGKYHIIDWKSCSWGWGIEKKTDRITTYQLTYYKRFFCAKHDIDYKKVETYFGLLKRTAKKNRVEIFRVSSGQRKINNSLNILHKAVYNINKRNHPKNRLKCERCEFNKTQWCP